MRPDPHKQKASRRYQAKHKAAAPASSTQEAGPSVSAEQSAFSEGFLDTGENAEAREEEDINEFLKYLKDESQRVSTEQSAVYFQLRAEAESAELGTHNEGVWRKLLDVNWDGSLENAASNTTLQQLLDTDYEFAPVDVVREGRDVAQKAGATIQTARVRNITRQLNAVDLAPNAKSPPALKQPPVMAKSAQPVDDLEAFLDDLL